jgi:hypothetical protein
LPTNRFDSCAQASLHDLQNELRRRNGTLLSALDFFPGIFWSATHRKQRRRTPGMTAGGLLSPLAGMKSISTIP